MIPSEGVGELCTKSQLIPKGNHCDLKRRFGHGFLFLSKAAKPQWNMPWHWRPFWRCLWVWASWQKRLWKERLCKGPPWRRLGQRQSRFWRQPKTSFFFEESGQATVELALVLPCALLVIALLLQPLCLFYTRMVMAHTASQAARVLATKKSSTSNDALRAYCLRRLRAIPNLEIFHEGGEGGWEVSFEGSEADHRVCVTVKGFARPLPLLGLVSALLASDGQSIDLQVQAQETLRPTWLEGSYDSWVSIWS